MINCQHLDGLVICAIEELEWDCLFKMLVQSSPSSLYKFKFLHYDIHNLESLNLFLDNWKGTSRHSMLLYTIQNNFWGDLGWNNEYLDLIEKYKVQGIVKQYNHHNYVLAL